MTKLHLNQKGSHLVVGLLLISAIGLVIFAGLKVYDSQQTSDVTSTTTTTQSVESSSAQSSSTDGASQSTSAADVPAKVQTSSDLASTEKLLDSVSVETDTKSVDSDLSAF